ncbi:MAG: DegT/DnrJ/EryC1/StrS family aminotransferase [Spirochaetales bacterium]|nr:DegT/DnrJ/EryC1/StrS family aminotransferase [Spirochaetales bacterium]
MGVLFSAPQAEFAIIKEKWLEEVEQLAKSGVFVGGVRVDQFESAFADFTGVKKAVGVANGTEAICLALKALRIGPGDEVITATNTFIATVEAIHNTGAKPVLVDCDPDTFLIDIEQAKKSKTAKTKAVIPVHLYGQIVDMTELLPWAEKERVHVVEDCAQAAGARFHDTAAGNFGIAGCFSFFPDKNLGAVGDGGMVVTSSDDLALLVKKLRNHGGDGRYKHEIAGTNSRLDPIQAVALKLKLGYLNEWNARRREIAGFYEKHLGALEGVILPKHRRDESHIFHLYVVRVNPELRETLKKQLLKKGVLTAIQYPSPVHLTDAFAFLGYQPGDFPVAERYAREIISLPMNITVTEQDVEFIASIVKEVLGKG